MQRGFTLLELTIVIIVIGILVVLSTPLFSKTKERALDKEAVVNLKLIQGAEKIYKMEIGCYWPDSDISSLNDNLKLAIPAGTQRNWDYTTDASGTAQATRCCSAGADSRTMTLTIDGEEASSP